MSGNNSSFESFWIATRTPQKTAVADYFGTNSELRELSYAELERGVHAIHALFEFFGVGQGSYVAVVAQNRSEVLEVFLAAFRIGAIPYAINPNLTENSVRAMFEELPPDFIFLEVDDLQRIQVLVDQEWPPQFIVFGEGVPELALNASGISCQSYNTLRNSPWNIPTAKHQSVPQFVVFTSGSTGVPKAILRDFTLPPSISLEVAGIKVYRSEASVLDTLQVGATPLFHSIGDTLKSVQRGIGVTMLRLFDADVYLSLIEKYQPSFLWLLPSHLMMCNRVKHKWQGRISSVKAIAVGGAPCSEIARREARELFQCPVISFYGLTEGGPQFTFSGLDLECLPANCVGRASDPAQVKLIDVAGNETDNGELCFCNESLFKGYMGNSELTRERLKDGWFSTGDIFTRDEQGLFYFQGRVDDMFVCGGENIYPLEVEKLLLTHPGVDAACVVPYEDAVSGVVPVAMVVQNGQAAPVNRKQLQDYCLDQGVGVGYPRWILVVDSFPVTGPGKVDRKTVKVLLAEAYRDWLNEVHQENTGEVAQTDSALLEAVTNMVRDIGEFDSVGPNDNVFRIGLSSFHVTLLCARISETFGIPISMEDIFRLETMQNIAAKIRQMRDAKQVLEIDLEQKIDTGITF